jgi:hypothetical protein
VEPTVEPTVDPTQEPAADESPSAVTPLPCPTDVKNHGAYVSQVARDHSVTGRDHGKAVSEAAHSDCGKPAGEDATEAPEATETEDADTDEQESQDQDDADSQDDTPKAHKHGKKHGRH